jgi:hypothetical protein
MIIPKQFLLGTQDLLISGENLKTLNGITLLGSEDIVIGDKTYTHNQGLPSAIWTIAHGLDKKPSVMVVDTANTVVIGQIEYIDNNNITLTFNGSFSGYAYIN